MTRLSAQVVIFTDEPGWHGAQLKSALKNHGIDAVYVSLTECHWNINQHQQPLELPEIQGLPIGAFVRGIPGGTLEQVIFRLDILHALEKLGVLVYNTPVAIEKTVDKAMTSFLLHQAGLPGPATWVSESLEQTKQVCEQFFNNNQKILIKPLFGSQGNGIQLLDKSECLNDVENYHGIYYLQQFINRKKDDWSDIRVFVINGHCTAAMIRKSDQWLTNRAQGAKCERIDLDHALKQLAETAVSVIGIDYAGVDIIIDDNDQPQIIEVNSIPAWWGLQQVSIVNIADVLIEHFISKMSAQIPLSVTP